MSPTTTDDTAPDGQAALPNHRITLDLAADGSGVVYLDGEPLRYVLGVEVKADREAGTVAVIALRADVVGETESGEVNPPADTDDPKDWIKHEAMSGTTWINQVTGERRSKPP